MIESKPAPAATSVSSAPACQAPSAPPPCRKRPKGRRRPDSEKAFVERLLGAHHAVEVELGADGGRGGGAEAAPQGRVSEKELEALGEGSDVAGRDDEAVLAVAQDVDDPVGRVADGGQAGAQSLDERAREAFPQRGHREDVGGGEPLGGVFSPA